ncbi:MAG: hypothetical protein LBV54_05230 [Puniceicoccales bacterium]|jgi:hypothetical protein|nr:hypothetical protein [Puniceicoccales bacterium]
MAVEIGRPAAQKGAYQQKQKNNFQFQISDLKSKKRPLRPHCAGRGWQALILTTDATDILRWPSESEDPPPKIRPSTNRKNKK